MLNSNSAEATIDSFELVLKPSTNSKLRSSSRFKTKLCTAVLAIASLILPFVPWLDTSFRHLNLFGFASIFQNLGSSVKLSSFLEMSGISVTHNLIMAISGFVSFVLVGISAGLTLNFIFIVRLALGRESSFKTAVYASGICLAFSAIYITVQAIAYSRINPFLGLAGISFNVSVFMILFLTASLCELVLSVYLVKHYKNKT